MSAGAMTLSEMEWPDSVAGREAIAQSLVMLFGAEGTAAMLDRGVDPHHALCHACEGGGRETSIRVCLERMAAEGLLPEALNTPGKDYDHFGGYFPLHIVGQDSSVEGLELLVEAGSVGAHP